MQILIVANDSYFAQCDNEHHSFLLETSYKFIFLNRKIKHFIIKKFRIQKSQLKKSILSVMYLCVYTHIRCIIFKNGITLTLHSFQSTVNHGECIFIPLCLTHPLTQVARSSFHLYNNNSRGGSYLHFCSSLKRTVREMPGDRVVPGCWRGASGPLTHIHYNTPHTRHTYTHCHRHHTYIMHTHTTHTHTMCPQTPYTHSLQQVAGLYVDGRTAVLEPRRGGGGQPCSEQPGHVAGDTCSTSCWQVQTSRTQKCHKEPRGKMCRRLNSI